MESFALLQFVLCFRSWQVRACPGKDLVSTVWNPSLYYSLFCVSGVDRWEPALARTWFQQYGILRSTTVCSVFQELTGESLPWQGLGFNSMESFALLQFVLCFRSWQVRACPGKDLLSTVWNPSLYYSLFCVSGVDRWEPALARTWFQQYGILRSTTVCSVFQELTGESLPWQGLSFNSIKSFAVSLADSILHSNFLCFRSWLVRACPGKDLVSTIWNPSLSRWLTAFYSLNTKEMVGVQRAKEIQLDFKRFLCNLSYCISNCCFYYVENGKDSQKDL